MGTEVDGHFPPELPPIQLYSMDDAPKDPDVHFHVCFEDPHGNQSFYRAKWDDNRQEYCAFHRSEIYTLTHPMSMMCENHTLLGWMPYVKTP